MAIDDAGVWAAPTFFDEALATTCTPALTTDGLRRCLPAMQLSMLSGVFADSACAVPALVASGRCDVDGGFATEADLAFCEPRFGVLAADGPWDGGVYRRTALADGGTSCTAQMGSTPLFSMRRVAATSFPLMTRAPAP